MAEESSGKEGHGKRVVRERKKSGQVLPPDSKYDWPKNLNELLEWYSLEVEDVSKAAQLRIQEATKVVADCMRGQTDLEGAAKRLETYNDRWRDLFYRGVRHVRGKMDEEIYRAMDEGRNPKRDSGPSR